MDTQLLIEAIWAANKHCYLPVIEKNKLLSFVEYKKGDDLILNQFSIAEPKNKETIISLSKLQVVITPLIAFNNQGYRLGTGGGYYDRTFGNTSHQLFMGLGFAAQRADYLPIEPWDLKLAGVITEEGIILADS